MKPVTIRMDDLYNGEVYKHKIDDKNGVYAFLSSVDGHPVAFEFRGSRWSDDKARRYLKNKKMNDIVYRVREVDGKVTCNSINLAARIEGSIEGENIRKILGDEKYHALSSIESEHGSSKPFIVKVIAMNFHGMDTVVGNGLEFSRQVETDAIKEFNSLTVNLGHLGFFEDMQVPIGNTVASEIDANGNPAAYAYIYPHGEAGVFRTNLRLAAAQGLDVLSKYSVSMRGRPVDVEYIDDGADDDVGYDVGLTMKPFARVKEWDRKSVDFVVDPALPGSGATNIINSIQGSATISWPPKVKTKGDKKVEITLTEVREHLLERDTIAFSDLYSIPCVKKAIDTYVELETSGLLKSASKDEKFVADVIENCDAGALEKSDRVKAIIESSVSAVIKKINDAKDSVEEIAKTNDIKLNKAHMLFVRDGITGDESEADILKACKSTLDLSDLDDKDFTLRIGGTDDDKVIAQSKSGSSREICEAGEDREI